jgi:plastocyanin
MATINIKRVNNQVVFDPPDLILGNNDFVVWANEDPAADPEGRHWPTLKGGANTNNAKDWWMNDSLPPAQAEQQAATSPSIGFGARTAQAQTITYVCAEHAGEVGTITIPMSTNINISAGAPATYNPATLTILTASNETVTFTNNDTTNAHQPFPQGEPPTTWVKAPIPAKGNTASNAKFTVSRTNQDQNITYNCALHPGEQGVIVIPKI